MVYVDSVTVDPIGVRLQVGKWYYGASATVCPTNATLPAIQWYSDDTNVATVNTSSGAIYAKTVGTTKVHATSLDGSGKSDSLNVTVVNIVDVSCVQLDRNALSLEKGTSCTLSATVCPENATNKGVNWSSSNPNVAKVSNGVVCGIANGTAVITATAADGKGACDCCTVTVTGNTLVTSVEVSPATAKITEGNSYQLSVAVSPDDATNKAVTWSSDNESIATVNANGVVTAKGVGSTKIRATAKDGTGRSSYCDVTVKARVYVTSVKIEPSTLEITEGSMRGLKAVVSPSDATNKSVSWSSSKAGIATVGSRSGCVKGLSPGTTTITAETIDGGFKAYCTVTVNEAEEEDTRPVVTIVEDNEGAYDFFKVTFPSSEGGLVWKSIGEDLSKLNQIMSHHWSRYYENEIQAFSNKQLALLYRLDPLGVEYYVNRRFAGNTADVLRCKDNIYIEIFGKKNGHFYFLLDENGDPQHIQRETVSDEERVYLYSNAEILFGAHTAKDLIPIQASVAKKLLEMLFSTLPGYDVIKQGVELYQALFFSQSVKCFTDLATDYLCQYIEEIPDSSILKSMLGWIPGAIDMINSAYEGLVKLVPPNLHDIEIYSTIQKQPYRVEVVGNNLRLSMKEIIDYCS